MQNSEHQLTILKRVRFTRAWGRRWASGRIFDLCITDKRLVIFNQRIWYLFPIIKNIFNSKKRRKPDPLKGLTIDELLKKDKKSYAVNFDELEWIHLNTSLFGSNLNFKGEKVWKLIEINKEQYDQLSQILPRIEALKGKLEINQ